MTINEIINEPVRFNDFKGAIRSLANSSNKKLSNKNARSIFHNDQEKWNKLLLLYKEYLNDIEAALNTRHEDERYKPNPALKTIRNLNLISNENQNYLLNLLGYNENEKEGLNKFSIIKNFFEGEEREISDGNAKVNDTLHLLNLKAQKISQSQPSIKTEEINYFPY